MHALNKYNHFPELCRAQDACLFIQKLGGILVY
jgi:hypothetical protein